MKMTGHAEQRVEQRAIPGVIIDLILDFGAIEYHKGREKMWLDKRGLREARRYLGKPHQTYSRLLRDAYLIVEDGHVVTVARKDRHHKRDRN